jgi:hypothetical protein
MDSRKKITPESLIETSKLASEETQKMLKNLALLSNLIISDGSGNQKMNEVFAKNPSQLHLEKHTCAQTLAKLQSMLRSQLTSKYSSVSSEVSGAISSTIPTLVDGLLSTLKAFLERVPDGLVSILKPQTPDLNPLARSILHVVIDAIRAFSLFSEILDLLV